MVTKKKVDRVARMKRKYGNDCYVKWGRSGGNPLILKFKLKNGQAVRKR